VHGNASVVNVPVIEPWTRKNVCLGKALDVRRAMIRFGMRLDDGSDERTKVWRFGRREGRHSDQMIRKLDDQTMKCRCRDLARQIFMTVMMNADLRDLWN
jgi:hypothetical protein